MQAAEQEMQVSRFTLSNGKVFEVKMPPLSQRNCSFILGVRKSGSTLLNLIIQRLCRRNSVAYVSFPEQAFEQNISFQEWANCKEIAEIVKDGAVYSGFRALPSFLMENELFHNRKKILLVRDPRDAIVSQYFSDAFSHRLPEANSVNRNGVRERFLQKRADAQNQSIDEYVLKTAPALSKTLSMYNRLLVTPNLKSYRYEDVVLNKRPWIIDMAEYLELKMPEASLQSILDEVDIVPNKEQSTQFVRRVVPGDHQNKLKPETIEQLNEIFSDFMKTFSYV